MALKPFNSIGGFSVGEVPSNVILANGDITTTNITTTGVSNLNSIGNVKILGGTTGQVVITDGTGNLSFSTIDTALISNGTSNVQVLNNSNVVTSVAGNTIFTVTAAGANLVGNITTSGIKTDNIYYANGTRWDLQEAAGVNNEVQFNLGDNFAASANFTFDPTTNLLSIGGNISGQNVNAGNLLTANFVGGTLTTAAQPNITSVGNLTALVVAGEANVTGNLVTGGTINSTGNVSAPYFFGNVVGNISGNIVVPGSNTEVIFNNQGNAGASNAFTFNSSSNVLTVNGNVSATNFIGSGASLSSITGANVTGTVANATYAVSAGSADSATTAGTVTTAAQPNITSVGTLTSVDVTGNVTAGNVYANSGIVAALTLKGEGGNISNIAGGNVTGQVGNALVAGTVYTNAQPNITSVGTLTSLAVTGNVSAGNVAGGNLVSANFVTGTLTTAAQPNITSIGTLTSLDVTGNITSSANIVTDFIIGKTTSVSIEATGANSNVFLKPTGTGTVDVWSKVISNVATPIASTDAATKQYVDDVAQGLHIHASAVAATQTTLASISGGTVTYNNGTAGVGATLTTTGTYTTIDGVTLTNGDRILVKDEANAAHNGIYVRTSTTVLTRADDFDTAAEIQGGDFTFVTGGTLYNSTGWVQIDDVVTVGTDPIEWVQFSGAGTYLAGTGLTLTGDTFSITNTAVSASSYGSGDAVATFTVNAQGQLTAAANTAITANAANLTGTTLAATIVNSSLTSVGTLVSLNVTGNVAAGNVSGTNVSGTTLTGTLTTAAQPNVTSLGTLTSLGVTGNVTAGNVYANAGTIGANVVTGNTLGGTLTTAAQPNVTSVGTLTSLAVTGNVAAGNVSATTATVATANVSGNVLIGSTTTTAGTVTTTSTTAAQTIAQFPVSGTTGIEYLVKGIDAVGGKHSVAKVVAVTDGANVDYTVFATVNIGTNTGTGLQVVVDSGNVKLQVTPSSSASTVWTTQYSLV